MRVARGLLDEDILSPVRTRSREVAPASSQVARTRVPGRAQWSHDDPH